MYGILQSKSLSADYKNKNIQHVQCNKNITDNILSVQEQNKHMLG